jgi:hypothetical protein
MFINRAAMNKMDDQRSETDVDSFPAWESVSIQPDVCERSWKRGAESTLALVGGYGLGITSTANEFPSGGGRRSFKLFVDPLDAAPYPKTD